MAIELNAAAVAAWDAVATAWDDGAAAIEEQSVPLTAAMLDRLAVCTGERVLELAAGAGSLGATWSRLVGPGGGVLLTDIAPEMVAVAARRNAALANVATAVADMAAIDLADGSFDAVACRMGLMFAPSPPTALAEIHRVLRHGGRFAALTWASPEHNPWLTCVARAILEAGLAPATRHGVGDVFALSDARALGTLVERAGFGGVAVDEVPIRFRAGSIDDHVRQICALAPPFAMATVAAKPEARVALVDAAAALTRQFADDGGLVMPGRALVVSGQA